MDYIFSRILPCMLCNALLCKGVLSKDFEYVPLQHKQSYRFQDLAHDSSDLIFWALWSGMKLERVHFKMLQFPGFLCSMYLKVLLSKIVVLCALKTAAISGIFLQLPGFLCSVHLKILQLPEFVCSVHLMQQPGFCCALDFCAAHLKNLQLPGVLCSVHLNMLQVSGFLCSVHLRMRQISRILCSVCVLRNAAISRIFVLNALRSAAISKILKWIFRPTILAETITK